MSGITIKHATIKFEKMDKKAMYVNASSASSSRAKVDKNYQAIVNAWKKALQILKENQVVKLSKCLLKQYLQQKLKVLKLQKERVN